MLSLREGDGKIDRLNVRSICRWDRVTMVNAVDCVSARFWFNVKREREGLSFNNWSDAKKVRSV